MTQILNLTTADGLPLKQSLAKSTRRNKIRAFLLVAPLLVFLVVSFVLPILDMLFRSVENKEVSNFLPNLTQEIQKWDGKELPDENTYLIALQDFKKAAKDRVLGKIGTRLNYEKGGLRSFITKTGRKIKKYDESQGSAKDYLIKIDKRWGEIEVWNIFKRESSSYTDSYYYVAMDFKYDNTTNQIVKKPEDQSIYLNLFWRTFWMSGLITLLTVVLGYPIAYLLSNLPVKYANLLMILVLLPFWTSLLVRTTTWIAVLQSHGVLNDIMIAIGLINEEGRLQMMHNALGTLIAMTHILLPFMILPLYSVMKTINPSYIRAARSLGATSFKSFRSIYFPLTIPGLGAGGVLVFILSIGYYITPALVGGNTGRFITNMIAHHMSNSLNWGLAAALATILLILVVILYFIYNRFANITDLKLG